MRPLWLAVLVFGVAAPIRDIGASVPTDPIRPESRVWITGASNIRRFTCQARRLSGALDLRGSTTRSPVLSGENVSTHPSLSVTVDRLDCGIGIMNQHLHDALQSVRHPSIEFRVVTYEVDLRGAVPLARIAGTVTIAGVPRPIAATAMLRADTLGTVHVRGSYVVRPTDFGVAPPRRFAGLFRVRDRIAVHFDVALDSNGAVDAIGCRLPESANSDLEQEGINAPHC